MKWPGGRKLLLFGVLSVACGFLAATVLLLLPIPACGMQPDVAATCGATPVGLTGWALIVAWVALRLAFFRRKISGVD